MSVASILRYTRTASGSVPLLVAAGITPTGAAPEPRLATPIVHVSPSGSDSNPGTDTAPVRTVRHGLLMLRPGSTLYVHGGTYDEVADVSDITGTAAAPILIRNAPGETATIRGRFQIDRPSWVTVQGLRLTRAVTPTDDDRENSVLTMNGGEHWVLRDNEVFDTVGYAALDVGGDARDYRFPAGLSPNLLTVRNNTFYRGVVNVRVLWGTSHLRLTRNAMVTATWSQQGGRLNVQGYCNWGADVTMSDNLAWDSDAALDHFHGASCSPVKSWTTIAQSGTIRVNPVLRAPTSCAGFQNAEPAAAGYGRYAPVDQVLAGRFDGGAAQAPVVANGSTVAERSSASGGAATAVRTEAFEYGTGGDAYVAGDWNGDGVTTPAAISPQNQWKLRDTNAAGPPDVTFRFDG